MIMEIRTSDFRNKCANCKYFYTQNHIDGKCANTENKIKIRQRFYNSKSCRYKEVKENNKNGF